MLCRKPPAMLTPVTLKMSVFLSRIIPIRLIVAPASEYSMPKTPVKSRPATTTRMEFNRSACLADSL